MMIIMIIEFLDRLSIGLKQKKPPKLGGLIQIFLYKTPLLLLNNNNYNSDDNVYRISHFFLRKSNVNKIKLFLYI